MNHYITLSLETHLFFARIMKEHALFLTAGFVCKDKSWIQKADWYRMQFETLLSDAVQLANGRVRNNILQSDELVTEFTIQAEKQTENLSGIQINTVLTKQEKMLRCGCSKESDDDLACKIQQMNYQSLRLLDGLIDFKESVLCEVSNCKLFTANYPLLIKHIIREAKLYRSTIEALMRDKNICNQSLMQIETFWNQIMMEHALFIRGLLDPSEEQLIDTADGFADDYKKLLEQAKEQDSRANDALYKQSLSETLKYREFKTAGAQGILNCEIASIILPLLADHVLREANHYLRLLQEN